MKIGGAGKRPSGHEVRKSREVVVAQRDAVAGLGNIMQDQNSQPPRPAAGGGGSGKPDWLNDLEDF